MNNHKHNHEHDYGYSHNHDVSNDKIPNLVLAMILNFMITITEVIGGILAGSLSLISEAHLNIKDMMVSETKDIYETIEHKLHEHFGINHVTLQLEYNGCCGVGIIKN